jgi:hypothetical protein
VVQTLPQSPGAARVRFVPRLAAPSLSLTRAQYTARQRVSRLADYAPGRIKPPVRPTPAPVCVPAPQVPAGLLGAVAVAPLLGMPARVVRLLAATEPELLPTFTLSPSGEPCFAPAALEAWR